MVEARISRKGLRGMGWNVSDVGDLIDSMCFDSDMTNACSGASGRGCTEELEGVKASSRGNLARQVAPFHRRVPKHASILYVLREGDDALSEQATIFDAGERRGAGKVQPLGPMASHPTCSLDMAEHRHEAQECF